VEATGFRPVLAINDQGLALGVIADGSWAVGGDSLLIGSAHERTRLRLLLQLLERPFREVEAVVTQQISGQPGPPWSELLTMALRWPTEYWADRALDWIEGGYADHELSGVLDEAGQMPTRSQLSLHPVDVGLDRAELWDRVRPAVTGRPGRWFRPVANPAMPGSAACCAALIQVPSWSPCRWSADSGGCGAAREARTGICQVK